MILIFFRFIRQWEEVLFRFITISNVFNFRIWHFFYSFKEPEYAMFRFTSIKGSCLATPRFWKKILPNGWRLFSKLAWPLWCVKNTEIPLLLKWDKKAYGSLDKMNVEAKKMALRNGLQWIEITLPIRWIFKTLF